MCESVVNELIQPYIGRGHCITADNYFTTFNLITELLRQKTTFIGTIRKNKRELPLAAIQEKRSLFESAFYENDRGLVLTIYQGTSTKNVLVLSSHHDEVFVDAEESTLKKKPNTIVDYNNTKYGVDTVDQMARFYTVKAPTRRWPLQVFYNILNLVSINSWVLYKETNKNKISRRKFLIKLIEEILEMTSRNEEVRSPPVKRKPSSSESPATPKRTMHLNSSLDPISAKPVNCQVKAVCKRNRAIRICESCESHSCGQCIAEEKIKSTCYNCIKNE